MKPVQNAAGKTGNKCKAREKHETSAKRWKKHETSAKCAKNMKPGVKALGKI